MSEEDYNTYAIGPSGRIRFKICHFLLIGTVEVSQQIILAVNAILYNWMLLKLLQKESVTCKKVNDVM